MILNLKDAIDGQMKVAQAKSRGRGKAGRATGGFHNTDVKNKADNANHQFSFSNHGYSSHNVPYSDPGDDESLFEKETIERVQNDSEYQKFEQQYGQLKHMFGEAKEQMLEEMDQHKFRGEDRQYGRHGQSFSSADYNGRRTTFQALSPHSYTQASYYS